MEQPADRRLIALIAVGCGCAVANLYYAQPLLSAIGSHFGISDGTAALLVTISQVCYGLAVVFVAPLSDLVDRRKLVIVLLSICCLGSACAAAAPRFSFLALAIAVTAATSVVNQILIPFAGTLAADHERGRILGLVMSGVLSGILLGRTVAGLIGELAGWRTVFGVAAILMALLGVAFWRAMPRPEARPSPVMRYGTLLASVATLIRREPALRRRMIFGAFGFGGFSLVWTTLAFLLSAPPFEFSDAAIGLFGLAGLGGALAAMPMGHLHDRGHSRVATGAALALTVTSWPILFLGRHSVAAILIGLVVLDFGVQGQTVLAQGQIYSLGRGTAGRVTTAYVAGNFIGGALGSAAGSVAWSVGGWTAVACTGLCFALVPLLVWLFEPRPSSRPLEASSA